MIIAMFLAHLVGDFILQSDRLAQWKSVELKGVLVHGAIVTATTWLFAIPFAPDWWQGIFFIGISHTAIDAFQWRFKLPIRPINRFLLDQFFHLIVIVIALKAGGFIQMDSIFNDFQNGINDYHYLVYLLGFAFLTMPAWVLLKFVGYALIKRSPPSFLDGTGKYMGIFERLLVATFVLMGQFLLVPLVAVPRIYIEMRQSESSDHKTLLMFELIAGASMAVFIGLILRQL